MSDEITRCHDSGLRMLASVADLVARSHLKIPDTLEFVDVEGDIRQEGDPVFRREFVTVTNFGGGSTIWSETPLLLHPDPNNNQSATVPDLSSFSLYNNQVGAEGVQFFGSQLPANLAPGQYILTIPESTVTYNLDPVVLNLSTQQKTSMSSWISYSAAAPPPCKRRNLRHRPAYTPSWIRPTPHVMPTFNSNKEPQRYPKPEIIRCGDWNSFPPFPKGSKEAKFEIEQTKRFYRDVFLNETRHHPSITREKCWNAARTWVRNHMETNQVRQSLPLDLSRTYRPPIPPGAYKVETEPISDDESETVSPSHLANVAGPSVEMRGRGNELMPPNQFNGPKKESVETFPLYLPVTPCWPTQNLGPIQPAAGSANTKNTSSSLTQDIDLDIMDYITKNIKLKFDEPDDTDD